MFRPVAYALAVALLARPDAALAAEAGDPAAMAEVEARAAEARRHYQAGEFDRAVALYLDAWRLAPAAALLYNIAHIYDRKLNEIDLAIDFYRRYIAAPDADPQAVARATTRITELKAEKEARRQAELDRVVRRPEPAPAPVVAEPVVEQRRTPTDPGATHRLAGWIGVGVGAALLAGGGAVGLVAQGKSDEFATSRGLDDKLALRDDGEALALTADVLYAAGAVTAVTGLVLLLIAPDAGDGALGLGPTGDGRGAAVWFGGPL